MDNYISVPTYENGKWSVTTFQTRDEFKTFISSVFKDAGPDESYNFDETTSIFNLEGKKFKNQKYYCNAPFKSKDYIAYWDDQKEKCRKGIIVKNKDKVWYLTREYYMWLNFLPIYNKETKKFDFADIRDAQYHMALYELLAELNYKHVLILKKRQIASSYFHMGKLINQYWFEEGAVLKIGASLKDYINEKGSWKFLDEYKNFLNEHTAWYRPCEPEKVGAWQQRIKVRINNRDTYKGLKSTISAYSFEQDPTNGVGGPVTYFFHEEAGIAPKMSDTYGFIKPALKSGELITGQFIAAGSVGDLTQCDPMKEYLLNPDSEDFFAVTTNLLDSKGTIGRTALFIPEQWSRPPYIDEYGNSLVKEALKSLDEYFAEKKKVMTPQAFQLELSQHPRNIEEAFASREESIFPSHLVSKQIQRINENLYPVEYIDLQRDEHGKIQSIRSSKLPILEFPVPKKMEDKSGIICIYERPIENPPPRFYYASIDPVGEGKTITSDSLCSIFIYRNRVEKIVDHGDGNVEHSVEGGKIVASWCGRFDDINKTHERLEMMIEWYNAWALIENNVALFIQYMISKKKQKYLVPKNMVLFLKDLGANGNVYQEYGWRNVGTLFKGTILSYGVEYTKEEINKETDVNGDILNINYGIEKIPDIMLLKEMQAYTGKENVDRLVAFCALIALVKVQESNLGVPKVVEKNDNNLVNKNNFSKLNWSPFKTLGRNPSDFKRNPFKNIK